MGQEALPFGTPSEPGADPVADAIERALAAAGLDVGGAAGGQTQDGDEQQPTSADDDGHRSYLTRDRPMGHGPRKHG